MIADTNFVISFLRERSEGRRGPARSFLAARRSEVVRSSVITVGEIAAGFEASWQAWEEMRDWTIYRLHPGIVDAAADVDRELMALGRRLGENDNWIAGFARYYREPIISRDLDFDRVPGLRRVNY